MELSHVCGQHRGQRRGRCKFFVKSNALLKVQTCGKTAAPGWMLQTNNPFALIHYMTLISLSFFAASFQPLHRLGFEIPGKASTAGFAGLSPATRPHDFLPLAALIMID
jgi:hypothetical protein